MTHYAKVSQGVVTKVIVAEPEFFDTFVDDSPGRWIQTSYNMRGGVYYDPSTGQAAENQSVISDEEGRQRKNFAGIGYGYDGTGFYPPKPYNSWTLNSSTYLWEAPVAYPDDGNDYEWNEETRTWDAVE